MSTLIVGLGNPGKQYEQTLHNAGALVVDVAIKTKGLSWGKAPQSIPALVAKRGDVLYAKPTTYMNVSGVAVQQLLAYYKMSPADLVVVHDDIDISMGDVRVEKARGAGGHNGIKSIMQSIGGDNEFTRVRVGVATKRTMQKEGRSRNVAKIVLKKPGFFDRKSFAGAIAKGVDAIADL